MGSARSSGGRREKRHRQEYGVAKATSWHPRSCNEALMPQPARQGEMADGVLFHHQREALIGRALEGSGAGDHGDDPVGTAGSVGMPASRS